jgi:hypothetical protein
MLRKGLLMRRWPIALVSSIVLVAALDGAAYAYWTSHGSGSGAASLGTAQPVTLVAVAGGDTPTSTLIPGGAAVDAILRIHNPNAYGVTLVKVTGSTPITADGSHSGCTTTGVTFANQAGLTISIPATGAGSTLVHVPASVNMSTGSSSGCQGATFSIPVTIEVHK